MVPVPTEDFELDPPGGSIWQSLLNLVISVLVVCAAALIGSFLSATSARAQGSLEHRLAPPISAQAAGARFARFGHDPAAPLAEAIPAAEDPPIRSAAA